MESDSWGSRLSYIENTKADYLAYELYVDQVRNKVEKNENWLKAAKSGIDFLRKYGMNAKGDFYFSTTQDGKPLVKAYNIFSDCFAAMAFSQYALVSGDEEIKQLVVKKNK